MDVAGDVYGALASCLPVLNLWGRWCVSEEYKNSLRARACIVLLRTSLALRGSSVPPSLLLAGGTTRSGPRLYVQLGPRNNPHLNARSANDTHASTYTNTITERRRPGR